MCLLVAGCTKSHPNGGDSVSPERRAADDSAAFAKKLLDAQNRGGGEVEISAGTYHLSPQVIGANVTLRFLPGAKVVPLLASEKPEKLFSLVGNNPALEGLKIAGFSGKNTVNKYLVYAHGASHPRIARCDLANVTASDGTFGHSNLVVTHGIYIDECSDAVVEDNRINTISGAAIFVKNTKAFRVVRNEVNDTGWYSVHVESSCYDGEIANNKITGGSPLARNWGGSINLMSQTAGGGLGHPNARISIHDNEVSGIHNYGAAIRVLSLSDSKIERNNVHDISSGTLTPGGVYAIGVDRRGTVEGADENGPCRNLTIASNVLRAGPGANRGISVNNQNKGSTDPHVNIQVVDNVIESPSTSAYFNEGIRLHGHKAGIDNAVVSGNQISVFSRGAIMPGGISVASSEASGRIAGLRISKNRILDISAAFPVETETTRIGIRIQATVSGVTLEQNSMIGFRYGLRIDGPETDIVGAYDNFFQSCDDEILTSFPLRPSPPDESTGVALPSAGLFRRGHIRRLTTAEASVRVWRCVQTGGAYGQVWSANAQFTPGEWVLTSSSRVYELVAVGLGATSSEPTQTVVGQEQVNADGYRWRLRATNAARWTAR